MGGKIWRRIQRLRNQILFVLIPLAFMPLPIIVNDQKSKCGFVLLLMSMYWVFKVLPIPVTGLIPFILLPMFGILTPKEISSSFFTDITVTFFAGFVCSSAMEKCGLHKRIALNILLIVGPRQSLLLVGFMIPTWILSVWISNTAVCVLMISIAEEVVEHMHSQALEQLSDETDMDIYRKTKHKKLRSRTDLCFENTAISLIAVRSDIHSDNPVLFDMNEYRSNVNSSVSSSFPGNVDDISIIMIDETENHNDNGQIENGDIIIGNGDVSLTNGDIIMGNGDISMTNGDIIMGNGDVSMTNGDIIMGNGDVSMTNGDIIMGNGNINMHDEDNMQIEDNTHSSQEKIIDKEEQSEPELVKKWYDNVRVCYMLAVGYTATIGGTASVIGTSVNLRVKQITDELWQDHGFVASPITFTSWLVLNLPASAINLTFIWAWFTLHFFGLGACSLSPGALKYGQHINHNRLNMFLREELKAMGRMKYGEFMVLSLLSGVILLWFFLEPDFMTGWADNFIPGYVTMTVPAAMIVIATVIIPQNTSFSDTDDHDTTPVTTFADWTTIQKKFPWGVVFIVGGGNSLAKAIRVSGLSDWITEGLAGMNFMPEFVIALLLCLMVSAFTEMIANTVAVNIFVPIAANLAEKIGKNPLYLIFPVALSASFSFILPMAGAVNAYIVTSHKAQTRDMVKAGIPINLAAILVTLLATHTWGMAYFDLDTIPWAANSTTNATTQFPTIEYI